MQKMYLLPPIIKFPVDNIEIRKLKICCKISLFWKTRLLSKLKAGKLRIFSSYENLERLNLQKDWLKLKRKNLWLESRWGRQAGLSGLSCWTLLAGGMVQRRSCVLGWCCCCCCCWCSRCCCCCCCCCCWNRFEPDIPGFRAEVWPCPCDLRGWVATTATPQSSPSGLILTGETTGRRRLLRSEVTGMTSWRLVTSHIGVGWGLAEVWGGAGDGPCCCCCWWEGLRSRCSKTPPRRQRRPRRSAHCVWKRVSSLFFNLYI